MTRQSLSRFLSERRELRTFMTLPLINLRRPEGRPAKRRGNYAAAPPLSTRQKWRISAKNSRKKAPAMLESSMRALPRPLAFRPFAALGGVLLLAGCAAHVRP